jgi:hypothetical protein
VSCFLKLAHGFISHANKNIEICANQVQIKFARNFRNIPCCDHEPSGLTDCCSIGYNEFYIFLDIEEYRPFDGCKIEI